ncbi:hypothetical protein LFL96_34730 (plasmid) [Paraburkholderia sp. D15]|uniref:hypothetical protein n=1 Tax=Paraburkholderia sp. D15 TaxID=2880218 RepID=UPI002479FF14|nr:hypothetical protein [Paraburkholderia sp. D15]WGS55109.1 hypothetical protein LFL96_34730 [Paraburkholderia sp. D15]
MFSINPVAARLAIALTATGLLGLPLLARADGPHLSLDDIDQLSRDKVVRQLKSSEDASASSAAIPPAGGLPAPLPSMSAPAPVQNVPPSRKAESPRSRSEPVVFVGAYDDATGHYVLYESGGGIYPARLGTKLTNGWTAEKVSGYAVTVSEGKHVWTEPIRGGAASGGMNTATLQAISDLGGPLPPGGPVATPIYPGK